MTALKTGACYTFVFWLNNKRSACTSQALLNSRIDCSILLAGVSSIRGVLYSVMENLHISSGSSIGIESVWRQMQYDP